VAALRADAMKAMVRKVGKVYVGKDPFDVEGNRREWYKHDFNLSISLASPQRSAP